jgi:multidrug efflux system outer membrane protein
MITVMAGCMSVGPDYHRPDTGIQVPRAFQHEQEGAATPSPEDRWWHAFDDTELNQFVEDALANNWDIKRATARVLEVQSQFVQTRAERFPSLDVQAQGARQRSTARASSGKRETDTYSLSLPASFELDLWGRLAKSEEAARADLLQAEENRYTVVQTIVAETITLYLQMEALERRIQIERNTIVNYRRSLALVEGRYKRGLSSVLDVRQARRTLAQAEATLPALKQELGIVQQKLSVLVGRYPETKQERRQPDDYYRQLPTVPAGLPSDLLLRRPDVRAAESGLKALNARIGVAKADRFPRITLTGSLGYTSDQLSRLFTPDTQLWNIALGITQPIFDAGKRKAAQKAAEARYQQGLSDYAKTVLTAFAEVEQALLTRQSQIQRRDLLLNFLAEAQATQKVAQERYQRGLTDYLTVLTSQLVRFGAEEDVVLAELAILSNRVTLHRALGGGWGKIKDGPSG